MSPTIDPKHPRTRTDIPTWDEFYLQIAALVATRSKCTRRIVGAVIVRPDHQEVSFGYNGTPAGRPECIDGACPRGRASYDQVAGLGAYDTIGSPGFCIANHAESNALFKASREDTQGATMYITDPPCPQCRKDMGQAGIARVVWPGGSYESFDEMLDFTP